MVTDPLNRAVPNELRDFADRSVEQARKAFDGFISVVNAAIGDPDAEPPANVAHVSRLAVDFAERNVQGAFDLAHSMVHATDLAQVLTLQREFLEKQMKALKSQMRTLDKASSAAGNAEGRQRD